MQTRPACCGPTRFDIDERIGVADASEHSPVEEEGCCRLDVSRRIVVVATEQTENAAAARVKLTVKQEHHVNQQAEGERKVGLVHANVAELAGQEGTGSCLGGEGEAEVDVRLIPLLARVVAFPLDSVVTVFHLKDLERARVFSEVCT